MTVRQTTLVLALLAALAPAGALSDWRQERAVKDSLSHMPARFRGSWLDRRGIEIPGINAPLPAPTASSEDVGLRLVGKWGRGTAYEVTGRGSLIALTLGSEVALLDFARPDSPVVLTEIQLDVIPRQSALYDSFLVVSDDGIEFWNISDPRAPVKRSSIPYTVGDFAIADTFLHFVQGSTFYSYSIADPIHPRELGRCAEGGYVTTATRNVAVVRTTGDVMDFVDVSDPSSPHVASTYPAYALGADAKDSICCANIYWSTDIDHNRFDVLDVSDPANVHRIGSIDSVGGWDVHMSGPFAFVSGPGTGLDFTIVDIQDPAHPRKVSRCITPGGNFGVWADWTSDYAYVADDFGLAVIDISNLNNPVFDTCLLRACSAVDICIRNECAYVAEDLAGMKILDVSDPARPRELGCIDTANPQRSICEAVEATDSFAFMGWPNAANLLTIDVNDPSHPVKVGGCDLFNWPNDFVLRDSFLYSVNDNRLLVINVARPRSPVQVGSCNMPYIYSFDLDVEDTLAFVANGTSLQIISVARPSAPYVVGSCPVGTGSVDVVDTIAYVTAEGYCFAAVSVARPSSPLLLDSLYLGVLPSDVVIVDTLAYLGGYLIYIVSVADPHHLRLLGTWPSPDWIEQLCFQSPYLYTACQQGGVCILESLEVGISEPVLPEAPTTDIDVCPTVAKRSVMVRVGGRGNQGWSVWDAAGRMVMQGPAEPGKASWSVDLSSFPPGAYWLEVRSDKGVSRTKLVRP